MRPESVHPSPDFQAAYLANERKVRIDTGKLACALVVVLMPVGAILDFVIYHEEVIPFLVLRLACSALVGLIWLLHYTAFGQRHFRWIGLPIVLLPVFFMSCMIAVTQGSLSPYYAGLNLVLLAVSAVGHWSLRDTMLSTGGVILMYLLACLVRKEIFDFQSFINNLYFLILTGLIVVAGNYYYNQLLFREFTLRYELDQNKRILEENNRKLKELDELKSRFFANISHELRTPLTLLLAPLDALQQQRIHLAAGETRELLQTMHANGMRLLKLINDLLDLVRLEAGRMEVRREPFALEEFIKGMGTSIRKVAEDKRINFSVSVEGGLGTLSADREKLEKIVLNLLFNAVKFTPSGGRVELRACQQGEELILQVSDTGMGISAAQLPFVFDRFWQADTSSKRKYQGVGIGLALVKELAEVQGGKASVESQEGKGTTMTVRIPFLKPEPVVPGQPAGPAKPDEEPALAVGEAGEANEWLAGLYRRAELFPSLPPLQESLRPVETAGGNNSPRVLVADDEPDMLRFLKSQLGANFRVLEAVDGQQAIEKAKQFLPDIILLDMMMPEKDGLQACRELRAHTPTQNIPIVLLTARADEETKLAVLAAGASDFLSKPFSLTELNVRLRNLIASHLLQRKLARQNQILESTLEQLKETESQLVQSEKLASLGRLSAGIIHEINNPLNYAKTGLRTLERKGRLLPQEQQADFRDQLKDIEEGVDRVKNIVSDLRTFTHSGSGQFQTVEVDALVTTALRFLSHEWKGQVRIERRIAEGQTIAANQNQLIQVLVNLLQNATDALKHKTFTDDQPTIWIEGRVEKGKSLVIIRDNGMGISSENRGKIFDPFFTTKEVGEGMGLGLSICYRLVQEHEGTIQVKSEPGKFCEFTLAFPQKP